VQGPAAALAPEPLLDYARAADAAFAQGDTNGCIRACQEAVRRALAFAGEGDLAQQAVFLGVSGPDLLRLQHLSTRSVVRLEDAAFSLYVLMQVLVRMMAAGLPVASP
jgi:mutual gliding-motility protein MglA